MSKVPPGGVANGAITTAVVVGVFIAVSQAGAAISANAAPGVVGVAGAPAPISYFTGGQDPAPPPPPPGCQPDSPDPACQPPPPPPHHHFIPGNSI